jgi:RNA polymerase sigma-70 factor (ECF subfamily)
MDEALAQIVDNPKAGGEEDTARDALMLQRLALGGEARRQAVAVLYRRFAPRFHRYFRAQRLNDAEAEDLVHDVFVKVVRACGEFRGEARADTWLWAIARNSLISRLRGRLPDLPLEDIDLDHNCDAEPALQAAAPDTPLAGGVDDCVQRGIGRFGVDFPDRARAIGFLVIEEWSVEDITRALGRTPGATREFLSQCRKKLRPYIEHCLELLEDRPA